MRDTCIRGRVTLGRRSKNLPRAVAWIKGKAVDMDVVDQISDMPDQEDM